MNTQPTATETTPLNIPDGPTISKNLLAGWLIGHGAVLPWNPTVDQIFQSIRKLAECAKKHDAAEAPLAALTNNQVTMNEPDFSPLTPMEAGALFTTYTVELRQTLGLDPETAKLRVRMEKPGLYARMTVNDVPALANAGFAALPPEPIFGPQMKAIAQAPERRGL